MIAFIIGIILVFIFWTILKIARIQLFLHKKKHYPKEYDRFGYTLGPQYIKDILRNAHPGDRRYTRLVMLNKAVFYILAALAVLTIYAGYQELS